MSNLTSPKTKDIIHSSQDFWEDFSGKLQKSEDFKNAIKDFAEKNNESEESLIAQLMVESFNDSDERIIKFHKTKWTLILILEKIGWNIKRLFNFLKSHFFDLMVFLVLTSIFAGVSWWFYHLYQVLQTPQAIVKSEQGIPAFYQIKSEDLETSRSVSSETAAELNNKFVGKYSSQNIAKGEAIRESILFPKEISEKLANRIIMTIPIKTDTLNSTVQPQTEIGLLLASENQPQEKEDIKYNENENSSLTNEVKSSLIFRDIILLKLEKKSEITNLIIAIKPGQLEVIKKSLGNAKIFVIQNFN